MKSNCLPYTALPGTSTLFGDYLYRFDRVSRFYDHNPHDHDALRAAALSAQLPEERRRRVTAALRKINGESSALNLLELPDTVAVVTGQQVGLFSGPAYTIYKALTAARLAQSLNESGIRAVPVFWLATEDHDLAEVDHAHVFDVRRRPIRLSAASTGAVAQPVGGIEIVKPPLDELRAALHGLLFVDEVAGLVEECYQPGRSYGEAFRLLLQKILAGYGLVFFDPMQPEIREIAAPLLRRAMEHDGDLAADVAQRSKALQDAGYHAQVHFEPHTSFFFRLQNGQRLSLRRNGSDYYHEALRISRDELLDVPANLSPNALLRPVMQDYLLPTAAYVGGPAELAYLAQSQVIYKDLLGRMPVAVPRSGFTLLDERASKLMNRHGLSVTDCFHGDQHLRERIAERLVPESVQVAFEQVTAATRSQLDRLHGELNAFDPTLGAALEKSRSKILYHIDKNRRKAAREALRRDELVSESASRLASLVFPDKHLQERYYSILPFLAAHGFDLIDDIYANTHRGCPDHLLLTV